MPSRLTDIATPAAGAVERSPLGISVALDGFSYYGPESRYHAFIEKMSDLVDQMVEDLEEFKREGPKFEELRRTGAEEVVSMRQTNGPDAPEKWKLDGFPLSDALIVQVHRQAQAYLRGTYVLSDGRWWFDENDQPVRSLLSIERALGVGTTIGALHVGEHLDAKAKPSKKEGILLTRLC